VIAVATARWTGFREGMMPFAIVASSAPIIALAPIMNQWFGLTNMFSKMAVVAVIVFFPVMINTSRGLVEVDPEEIELMRSYAAEPRQLVRKVRIPNALPYLFSALKVATVLSVIGAIVAEYFGGPRERLGVYITQQASLLHTSEAWAAIIVATVLGVGFYTLVLVLERVVMPWHSAFRAGAP
jgi:NitT/TauT family transport system permease protein